MTFGLTDLLFAAIGADFDNDMMTGQGTQVREFGNTKHPKKGKKR